MIIHCEASFQKNRVCIISQNFPDVNTEFEKKIKDIFGNDSIKIIFGLDHPDDVCIGYFIIKLLDNLKEHKTKKTNQLISEIEKKYGKQYFEDQSPD